MAPPPLLATDYAVTPDTYARRVAQLKAGDRLLLRPGHYRDGLRIHGMQGSADAPITIQGPASGAPAVFLGRENANTISISDAAYVVIRNLILDGRDLPVDAVRVESRSSWAHDMTLENLVIVNHGHDQQIVGISAQSPAWNWTIRRNIILGAGTGMYLGSFDGRHPFVHGLIEDNLVVDTIGYNLQIKHQNPRPAIAGMPTTDGTTVIRGNVFLKGNRSSHDRMARPNVLVGHFPASGPGVEDRYLVEGNVFFGNPTEALFQGEGNVTLSHNLFINPYGDGIALQPHHAAPRRIEVVHNFMATRGVRLRVRGTDPQFPAILRDNDTFDMAGLAWDTIGVEKQQAAANLRQAIERWSMSRTAADGESTPAARALKRALRLACGPGAAVTRTPAWKTWRLQVELLCALAPRP